MITAIDMWKAPAGNWIVMIFSDRRFNELQGWYDYDYPTPEKAAEALTSKIRMAM